MNKLSGHKDLEYQVMEFMDDRALFSLLQTNPEYLNKVQRLAEKRVKDIYPTLVKWKDENETWFHYYASIVYNLSLLKERYDMEFILFLFKAYSDQPKEILKDFERSHLLESLKKRYMLKHALYKLLEDEKKISIEEFNKLMGDIIRKMLLEIGTNGMYEVFFITLLELGQLDLFKELWDYNEVEPNLLKRYLNDEEIEEIIDYLDDYFDWAQERYEKYENAAVVSNDPEIVLYLAEDIEFNFDKKFALSSAIKEKNFNLIPTIESIEGEEE